MSLCLSVNVRRVLVRVNPDDKAKRAPQPLRCIFYSVISCFMVNSTGMSGYFTDERKHTLLQESVKGKIYPDHILKACVSGGKALTAGHHPGVAVSIKQLPAQASNGLIDRRS